MRAFLSSRSTEGHNNLHEQHFGYIVVTWLRSCMPMAMHELFRIPWGIPHMIVCVHRGGLLMVRSRTVLVRIKYCLVTPC